MSQETVETFRKGLEDAFNRALRSLNDTASATVKLLDNTLVEGAEGITFDVDVHVPLGVRVGIDAERFGEAPSGHELLQGAAFVASNLIEPMAKSMFSAAMALGSLTEESFMPGISDAEVDDMLAETIESEIELGKLVEDVLAHGVPEDET